MSQNSMSKAVIKHFISITKILLLDEFLETYKTSKHCYADLSNLFLNVQDYARKELIAHFLFFK